MDNTPKQISAVKTHIAIITGEKDFYTTHFSQQRETLPETNYFHSPIFLFISSFALLIVILIIANKLRKK